MIRQTFYLVVEDVVKTKFMQHADLFEPFKFVGMLQKAIAELSKSPAEMLKEMIDSKCEIYRVVGVVVVGGDSAFIKNRRVLSDGEMWLTVDDLCARLGSNAPTMDEFP